MRNDAVPGYLPSLTGLRFYAAAMVVLYHLTGAYGRVPVVSDLVRFGNMGVTFFFVLSGFVLAWTYWGKDTSLRVFYFRRFARIWPLHMAALAIAVAVYSWTQIWPAASLSWDVLWPSFFLIHSWFTDWYVIWGGSGASWSLSDEAFFYFLFPLAAMIIACIRRATVFIVATSAMALIVLFLWLAVPVEGVGEFTRSTLLSYHPLSRLPHFVAGVLIATAIRRGWRSPLSPRIAVLIAVVYATTLWGWSTQLEPTSRWYPQAFGQLMAVIPFGLLIASVATHDLNGKSGHLARPFMVLLGQASFAWYLLHHPTILVWTHVNGPVEELGPRLIAFTIVLFASQLISIAAHLWFEHPVEKWLRPKVSAGGPRFNPGGNSKHLLARSIPPQPRPGS